MSGRLLHGLAMRRQGSEGSKHMISLLTDAHSRLNTPSHLRPPSLSLSSLPFSRLPPRSLFLCFALPFRNRNLRYLAIRAHGTEHLPPYPPARCACRTRSSSVVSRGWFWEGFCQKKKVYFGERESETSHQMRNAKKEI